MVYPSLFNHLAPQKTVRVGVIGTGHFATAVVTQASAIPRLEVPVVADVNIEAARRAYRRAGIPAEQVAVCESREAALRALENGWRVILNDALLLMDLPLDVVVEATGVPEAGARHVLTAIGHGKHVAMVNKETDATVGPILKYLADRAGVVYTAVDGDQHGLLISLVAWAQELGLEVLCGGKARDAEFVYDPNSGAVWCADQEVVLDGAGQQFLRPIPPGESALWVNKRQELLSELPQVGGYDLVELAIAANATGLLPDVETLHAPALHTAEIPEALCPLEEGGILQQRGAIEAVTCLRLAHEAGLGGGVFMVIACENDYSRHILTSKGLIANSRDSTALIYRPYHLCGVETPISLLCAGLLGHPTGATELRPRVDVVARTRVDLKAGCIPGDDHSPDLQALLRPAQAVQTGTPLPFHMGNGNPLAVDVPAGTVITAEMVAPPLGSTLWSLRVQQDQHFLVV
jgi:predicted homoserine dehydrogenase-like protein